MAIHMVVPGSTKQIPEGWVYVATCRKQTKFKSFVINTGFRRICLIAEHVDNIWDPKITRSIYDILHRFIIPSHPHMVENLRNVPGIYSEIYHVYFYIFNEWSNEENGSFCNICCHFVGLSIYGNMPALINGIFVSIIIIFHMHEWCMLRYK